MQLTDCEKKFLVQEDKINSIAKLIEQVKKSDIFVCFPFYSPHTDYENGADKSEEDKKRHKTYRWAHQLESRLESMREELRYLADIYILREKDKAPRSLCSRSFDYFGYLRAVSSFDERFWKLDAEIRELEKELETWAAEKPEKLFGTVEIRL